MGAPFPCMAKIRQLPDGARGSHLLHCHHHNLVVQRRHYEVVLVAPEAASILPLPRFVHIYGRKHMTRLHTHQMSMESG